MIFTADRDTEDRLGDKRGGFVKLVGKAFISTDIRDDQGFTVLGDPARNPFTGSNLHSFELLCCRGNRDFKSQIAGFLIAQKQ